MLKPLWHDLRYAKVHYNANTIKTANIYHIAVPEWMDARLFDFHIILCGTLSDSEYARTRVDESKYIVVRRPPRGRKLCGLCKANYKKLQRLLGEDYAIIQRPSAAADTWKRNSLAIRAKFTRRGAKIKRNVIENYKTGFVLAKKLSRDFRALIKFA